MTEEDSKFLAGEVGKDEPHKTFLNIDWSSDGREGSDLPTDAKAGKVVLNGRHEVV